MQVVADLLADELLDLGDPLLGLLDAGAAGGADVHLEGAGVDLGEELAAQLGAEQAEDGDQQRDGAEDGQQAVLHHRVEPADVPGDAPLDQRLPAGERPRQQAAAILVAVRNVHRAVPRLAVAAVAAVAARGMRLEPGGAADGTNDRDRR